MKKLLILICISILTFGACSLSTKPSTPVMEDQNNNIAGIREENSMSVFQEEGFSFEYPREWTREGNEYLYAPATEKENWHWHGVHIYTGDTIGPRCAIEVTRKEFKDSFGRNWSYTIMKAGIPEDLVEMCEDAMSPGSGNVGSAETTLRDKNGKYLATIFYKYNSQQETESLAEFEQILNSVIVQ